MSRAATRAARRLQAVEWFFEILRRVAYSAIALIVAALLLTPSVVSGPSSSSTAAPAAETSTPTPTESQVATPTPTPSESVPSTPKAASVQPQSLPATLTIPKAGISGASITQFDAQRDMTTRDGHQELVPPSMTAVVWYNVGDNTLTSSSHGTAALYCHANTEADPGICQGLHNVKAGDELVLQNTTEKLTYQAMADPAPVPKADAAANAGFQANLPLTIEMITCDRYGLGGGIGPDGHAYDNVYVFFKLVHFDSLLPPVPVSPQVTSRLR